MFFALSLKRYRDRGGAPGATLAGAASRGRWSVRSDTEFVALRSVLRAARRAASPRLLAGAETALFH